MMRRDTTMQSGSPPRSTDRPSQSYPSVLDVRAFRVRTFRYSLFLASVMARDELAAAPAAPSRVDREMLASCKVVTRW
jgi:hypothetical protein